MKLKLLHLLRSLLALYLLVCVLVFVFQRRIIYFPFHKSEPDMLVLAGELGCEAWRDSGGAIIGWKSVHRGPPAANRLILFHGNTGYALNRTHYLRGFQQIDHGRLWEVYLFEYPGYGARPGKLGQEQFTEAGLAAIEALRAADPRPIYLLGESLGSGLASVLAQRDSKDLSGVFLLTPYARLGDVAAHRFPFLPVRLMIRDRWDNVASLQSYHGPVAILVAGEDDVVTAPQGRLLFDSYEGTKRLWTQPGATHNGIDFRPSAPWWQEVSEFLLVSARPRS